MYTGHVKLPVLAGVNTGLTNIDEWRPKSCWPVLNENEIIDNNIYMVVSATLDNTISFNLEFKNSYETYTVDWGNNCTPEVVVSDKSIVDGTLVTHTYDYSNSIGSLPCTGYHTWLIKIYDCADKIIKFKFNKDNNIIKYTPVHYVIINAVDIEDLSTAFKNCIDLECVKILGDKYNSLNNITSIFEECTNLQYVKLPDQIPILTSFENAFKNCKKLTNIKLPYVVSSKLYNLSSMFYGCISLEYFEWLTEPELYQNISNCSNMFYKCKNLQYCNIPKFNTSSTVSIDMNSMFFGCESLYKLIFDINLDYVTNADSIFAYCRSLPELSFENFFGNKINVNTFDSLFYACSSLRSVYIVTSAIDLVFTNCFNANTLLNKVEIKENVKKIMFSLCDSLIVSNLKFLTKSNFLYGSGDNRTLEFYSCDLDEFEINNILNNLVDLTVYNEIRTVDFTDCTGSTPTNITDRNSAKASAISKGWEVEGC